jgi:putative cell wall-binding protein
MRKILLGILAVLSLLILTQALAQALALKVVILVSDNEADLTVAVQLSNELDIPMVITRWGEYEREIVEEIERLKPDLVWIIGEYKAVPLDYRDELKRLGIDYKVLGGATRQQTSLEIYEEVKDMVDLKPLICDGVEPIAAEGTIPIYVFDSPEQIKEKVRQGVLTDVVVAKKGRAVEIAVEVRVEVPEALVLEEEEVKDSIEQTWRLVEEMRALGEERKAIAAERVREKFNVLAADIERLREALGKKAEEAVEALPELKPLEISLPAFATEGESISIMVASEGEPVAGVNVYALGRPSIEAIETDVVISLGELLGTTDASGRLEVTMDKGIYAVAAEKEGYLPAVEFITVKPRLLGIL